MYNGYSQSEIIGVEPKNYFPDSPALSRFTENPLKFNIGFQPGLECFTGNISASLGSVLIAATGGLSVSPTFLKLSVQEAGLDLPDNQLRNSIYTATTSLERKNLMEKNTYQWILNDFGQVFRGSFWQVNSDRNGQLAKGVIAYADSFQDLVGTPDFKLWAEVTGIKNNGSSETARNAINMLDFLGTERNPVVDLYQGHGRAKDTNPIYQAARRLKESGLAKTVDKGHRLVPKDTKSMDTIKRLSNRITNYHNGIASISNEQCINTMEVNPGSCLGINPDRWEIIRSALNIYTALRAQNHQNKV
jgi:hypothetical protein